MGLDILTANDRVGAYPPSWYAATAMPLEPFPKAAGEIDCDVAVIGGGYTGLSAALHLAEAGYDVVVLEAHRVGFGASGRNGGQISPGQRIDQDDLEELVGPTHARALWDLSLESMDLTLDLVTRHAPEADFVPGLMLDLLPAPGLPVERLRHAETDFDTLFTHACYLQTPPEDSYAGYHSIAWAFGAYARLSWQVDARYHAFGTFDSLRKIPFFQVQKGRHLNQGFHTLHHTDGRPQPGHEIWAQGPILPVHHYKLVKLFSDSARQQMVAGAENYHARTGDNLMRIFSGDDHESAAKLRLLDGKTIPAVQMGHVLNMEGV